MSRGADEHRNDFPDNAIRIGAGFVAAERPMVCKSLSALAPHMGRWDPRDVEVDVSLQDRGSTIQRVTLRARVPGIPMLIATADNADIARALSQVKREMIRQLAQRKSMNDPMNNGRRGRATIRRSRAPSDADPGRQS